MPKNNFLITITICTALLTNSIFAGIYQVAVLQSPDGSQLVRIYFDNHALGTIEQNEQQFEIIANSIKQFSATGKHLEILIEAPDFYHPIAQDWVYVLGEKKQPGDIPAITHKTLQTQFAQQTIEKHQHLLHSRSSLYKFPYLIGKKIIPTNPQYQNIRLISVDPRSLVSNLYMDLIKSISGTVDQSLQHLSLNAIFTQILDEARATYQSMDYVHAPSKRQEAANTTLHASTQEIIAQTASPQTEKYREKINAQYTTLHTEFINFMHAFEAELGADAWNRTFEPNTSFETLFNREQQAIIKKYIKKMPYNDTQWLEYNLLQHIVQPESSKEIAIFVGGEHAENIINILTQLDYTSLYARGYTDSFVNLFFEQVSAKNLRYGLTYSYPPKAFQEINFSITQTLSAHGIPPIIELDSTRMAIRLSPHNLRDTVIQSQAKEVKNILMQPDTNPLEVNSFVTSDHINFTPLLHVAIHNAQTNDTDKKAAAIRTIETLLNFGANPNMKNSHGQNAFDISAENPEISGILRTDNINSKYLGLQTGLYNEQYNIELTNISSKIIEILEEVLADLKQNEDSPVPLIISLKMLSKLYYLTEKLAPNDITKAALLTDLSTAEALCKTIQASPEYADKNQTFKEVATNLLAKIEIMKPGFQPHKEIAQTSESITLASVTTPQEGQYAPLKPTVMDNYKHRVQLANLIQEINAKIEQKKQLISSLIEQTTWEQSILKTLEQELARLQAALTKLNIQFEKEGHYKSLDIP